MLTIIDCFLPTAGRFGRPFSLVCIHPKPCSLLSLLFLQNLRKLTSKNISKHLIITSKQIDRNSSRRKEHVLVRFGDHSMVSESRILLGHRGTSARL